MDFQPPQYSSFLKWYLRMTKNCTAHRGSGFESFQVNHMFMSWAPGMVYYHDHSVANLLFLNCFWFNRFWRVDPMWKYDWLKGYLHSMTDSSWSTNIHFCLGCASKHKAWTGDGSTYHADSPFPSVYPAGRFGPATQLWFDYKFASACSTLSVGRDSRRVKKSHKERTVGRDSLSPFFFQSFPVRSSRPTESLEQANFCLKFDAKSVIVLKTT